MIDKTDERADWARLEAAGGVKAPASNLVVVPPGDANPRHFRRLKPNELVSPGDFVSDDLKQFEPWDGPRGFQAGSFVKPIYRETRPRATGTAKSK